MEVVWNDPHLVNGLYRWLHCTTELTQSKVIKQEVNWQQDETDIKQDETDNKEDETDNKQDETDNTEDETDNKEDERPFYKQTLQRTFII